MAGRLTFSGASTGVKWPDAGTVEGFGNEYARHVKTLYDASVLPLTGTAGTADAVTATLAPVFDAEGLKERMKFTIVWAAANTGPVTLSINGGAAKAVVDNGGNALAAASLSAGLVSQLEYVGGAFVIHAPLVAAGGGGAAYNWKFTASGTWTKPSGLDPDRLVTVYAWGGGGSGAKGAGGNGGGGGAGSRFRFFSFRLGDLPDSVAVGIGAGGTAVSASNTNGNGGGATSFGTLLTVPGGNPGLASGGPGGGGGGEFDGGGGGAGVAAGSGSPGKNASYGAGGGGGSGVSNVPEGGTSEFAGAGGTGGDGTPEATSGTAPGGGGGGCTVNGTASGAGARGEVRIFV